MPAGVTEFGNPILRQKSSLLKAHEITNKPTQELIANLKKVLLGKKLGVGLAAPQIGINKAIAIVAIRPSKDRPKTENTDIVIINPEIIESVGNRKQLYEGCISAGSKTSGLFAKVPRYKKIKLKYYDENGELQQKYFSGLSAHVIQHEVDHLNGILFVDKVKDTKSYITYKEYVKLAKLEATKRRPKQKSKQ